MEPWRLQKHDVNSALLEFAKTLPLNAVASSTISTSTRSDIDNLPESIRSEIKTDRHSLVTLTCSGWGITAGPLFQDSLLSTEVLVNPIYMNDNPSGTLQSSRIRKQNHPTVDNAQYSLHNYRRHDPLPNEAAALVYQVARTGPVISLFADFIADNSNICWSGIYRLCRKQLDRNSETMDKRVVPILAVTGRELSSEITSEFENGCASQLALHQCKLQNSFDQLNMIGKSALCIADSTAIAVDAIRLSTPFCFLSRPPPGWESIQDCILRYIHHGDKNQLLREQKIAFQSILISKCELCCVVNHKNTLVVLLHKILGGINGDFSNASIPINSTHERDGSGSNISTMENCSLTEILSSKKLILSGLHGYTPKPDRQKIFSTGIIDSKRKYQKFRESPRRFVTDSKHWPFKPSRQHR